MHGKIGVFTGSASSFNLVRAAANIGQVLSEQFTPHIISTERSFAKDLSGSYAKTHGVAKQSTVTGEVSALHSYIKSSEPDALFQITQPPVHSTIVGTLSAIYDVPFVYRYSGDRFYQHRVSKGINRILHFGLNNILGRGALYLANECVALGPTGKERLTRRGIPKDDVSIIPPIVDDDLFSADGPQVDLKGDHPVGLFVGRLSRKKGRQLLERTLPEILERRPELRFVFVGPQPEELNIPSPWQNYISLFGTVPPEEVPKYYRAASFVIHPSLTEGVPRAVLEANATGTPTIANDVGDVDYVTDTVFADDSEFVELVCNFEMLESDEINQFTFEQVKIRYTQLFEEIT